MCKVDQEMKGTVEVGVEGNSWERGLFLYTWDHVVVHVMIRACGLGTASRERVVIVVTGTEDKSTHPPTTPRACTPKRQFLMEYKACFSVFSAGLIKEHLKLGPLLSAPSFLDFKF